MNKRNDYSIATCREYVAAWGWWELTSVGSEMVYCLSLVFILHGYAVFTQFRAVRINLYPPKNQTGCHTWRHVLWGKLPTPAILAESCLKAFKNWSTVRHLKMDHSFLSQLASQVNCQNRAFTGISLRDLKDTSRVLTATGQLWTKIRLFFECIESFSVKGM